MNNGNDNLLEDLSNLSMRRTFQSSKFWSIYSLQNIAESFLYYSYHA